uniref:Uncharacterized protein n=1 Tax=Arundo donax TaxID=35708 RepID=A0A0A9EWR2_ARUDO
MCSYLPLEECLNCLIFYCSKTISLCYIGGQVMNFPGHIDKKCTKVIIHES